MNFLLSILKKFASKIGSWLLVLLLGLVEKWISSRFNSKPVEETVAKIAQELPKKSTPAPELKKPPINYPSPFLAQAIKESQEAKKAGDEAAARVDKILSSSTRFERLAAAGRRRAGVTKEGDQALLEAYDLEEATNNNY